MHINFGAVTPVNFNPKYAPEDKITILRHASDLPDVLKCSDGRVGDLLSIRRFVIKVSEVSAIAKAKMKAGSSGKQEWCDFILTDQDERDLQTWIRQNRNRFSTIPPDVLDFIFYHEFIKPRLQKANAPVEIKKYVKPLPSGAFYIF